MVNRYKYEFYFSKYEFIGQFLYLKNSKTLFNSLKSHFLKFEISSHGLKLWNDSLKSHVKMLIKSMFDIDTKNNLFLEAHYSKMTF